MALQCLEELMQAVLGQAIGIDGARLTLFVQRAALHAILEAGTCHQHLLHPGLYCMLDEVVVCHQVLLQVEQRLIVG